jgi:hypothetical protein
MKRDTTKIKISKYTITTEYIVLFLKLKDHCLPLRRILSLGGTLVALRFFKERRIIHTHAHKGFDLCLRAN